MKYIAFLGLALSGFAVAAPAHADGKAAIKPPVVIAPTPLQPARTPQPVNCCNHAPAPVQPQIISREVTSPPQGLKLDDSLVLSMSGGVGTGVSDVGLGFGSGSGFAGSGRSDFGRSGRFSRARFGARSRGRSSGRRAGRSGGGRR